MTKLKDVLYTLILSSRHHTKSTLKEKKQAFDIEQQPPIGDRK